MTVYVLDATLHKPAQGFFYRSSIMAKIIDYIQAVRGELTHVSWPTRNQAVAYTVMVISISLVVAFVLGVFDFIFTYLLELFIVFTR